jgi:hypothetical protein
VLGVGAGPPPAVAAAAGTSLPGASWNRRKHPPLEERSRPGPAQGYYGTVRCCSALLIVMGQAVRARRIKTASAESPSWRLSLSSSISRATTIGAYQDGEIQGVAGPGIHQLDAVRPFRLNRGGIGARDQAVEPDFADTAAEAPDQLRHELIGHRARRALRVMPG